jgi:hypothetical protein
MKKGIQKVNYLFIFVLGLVMFPCFVQRDSISNIQISRHGILMSFNFSAGITVNI